MSARFPNKIVDKQLAEHEICRLVYLCLQSLTGITPPWGLLTGIRPVKKMADLIASGKTRQEAFDFLKSKYMVSDNRLQLAYSTALNQIPL